jgi:hypothetical protein
MRHVGRDVEKVSGSCDEMLLKCIAIPHAGLAAEDLDGRLMAVVLMRLGAYTRWERHDLQVNSLRPHGFGRDPRLVQERLLASEYCPRANGSACQLTLSIVVLRITPRLHWHGFCFRCAELRQTVWKVASIGFLCGLRRARI